MEDRLLTAVESTLLNPQIIDAAVSRAANALADPGDHAENIRRLRNRKVELRREIDRLIQMVAQGSGAQPLPRLFRTEKPSLPVWNKSWGGCSMLPPALRPAQIVDELRS